LLARVVVGVHREQQYEPGASLEDLRLESGIVQTIFVGASPRLALSVAGEGELLLFLHGIGGRRQNWAAQLAFFSATHKAAAWDARGYGESEDYDGPLDFTVFSEDLQRVLDHFGVRRAHVVGL